jgi:glycosyltransferase involved in cell wall biosynthesis
VKIAFVWNQFGEYHCDRCEAVAAAMPEHQVIGIEFCRKSLAYAWPPTGPGRDYAKVTLFEDLNFEATTWSARLSRLIKAASGCDVIFLAGYDRVDNFLAAVLLRLFGRRVVIMNDSKFDDKPRRLGFEWFKSLALLPYSGALVAGVKQAEYFRFLGFRAPITLGYDTMSLARLRGYLGDEELIDVPYDERPFLFVGRFVPKKNLKTLIQAYGLYREKRGGAARDLVLIGDGPLRPAIEAQIASLGGGDHIRLAGFLDQPAIARAMSSALCLITPSIEEQWGLVINEALAFDLPVIASSAVGATETLVRSGVNGFLIEPGNVAGIAFHLCLFDADERLWRRLREGARAMANRGDVGRFVDGAGGHWRGPKTPVRGG